MTKFGNSYLYTEQLGIGAVSLSRRKREEPELVLWLLHQFNLGFCVRWISLRMYPCRIQGFSLKREFHAMKFVKISCPKSGQIKFAKLM